MPTAPVREKTNLLTTRKTEAFKQKVKTYGDHKMNPKPPIDLLDDFAARAMVALLNAPANPGLEPDHPENQATIAAKALAFGWNSRFGNCVDEELGRVPTLAEHVASSAYDLAKVMVEERSDRKCTNHWTTKDYVAP